MKAPLDSPIPTPPRWLVPGAWTIGALLAGSGLAQRAERPFLAEALRGLAILLTCGLSGQALAWLGTVLARQALGPGDSARAATDVSSAPPGGEPATPDAPFATDRLKAELEAARAAHDVDRVLGLRRELLPRLDAATQADLDRDLAGWLVRLVQKRLVGGHLTVEVVELAGRIAETFATTKEGASLRASLPILRRGAGLCPGCGAPYAGIDDACPKCLATPPVFATFPDDEEDDLPESGRIGPPSPSGPLPS